MPARITPKREGSSKKKTRWLKEQVTMASGYSDSGWADGRPDDIVIVVMGPTGVGKSTFVNHLISGKVDETVEAPAIGHKLESCTMKLQAIPIPIPARGRRSRLVIVDTPGFDDTYADDTEILTRIASWLASSYSKDMKLGGVIYLHDISQARMLGTTRRNFEMFQLLCGNSAAKSMILGSTKWSDVTADVGERREKELCDKFWGNLTKHGARTERFENTSQSAWKIVNLLVNSKIDGQILQIQKELVELEKIIPTTEAGQKLRFTLKEVLDIEKGSAKKLGAQGGDEANLRETWQLIENLAGQIDQLKAPMWHRFKSLLTKTLPSA